LKELVKEKSIIKKSTLTEIIKNTKETDRKKGSKEANLKNKEQK
jgi:hypothetical protein